MPIKLAMFYRKFIVTTSIEHILTDHTELSKCGRNLARNYGSPGESSDLFQCLVVPWPFIPSRVEGHMADLKWSHKFK